MVKKIIFILLLSVAVAMPVLAAEEQGAMRRIPYATAVRDATRDLPGITAMNDAIGDLQDMREDLRSLLELRRVTGSLTREERNQREREIANLGAQINTMRAMQETIRISTEAALRASITTINNTELDIKLLELAIGQFQTDFNTAQLRFNAGLISESDLRAVELALQQKESNLASLSVMLETERQELNRILQRPVTGNFYVFVERELMELPDLTNAYIRQVVNRQPVVRQREIALNRASAYLNDVRLDFGSPERADRERARNQAERERNEIVRLVETAMRNHYNTLTTLLHRNESLEIDLARAVERYETTTLNYQAGLATHLDIEAAALGVLNAEVEIEKNLNTFWNAQYALENPFLLVPAHHW